MGRRSDVNPVLATAIHSMILEDLANRLLKPNILSIKLGTQLQDGEASEEKKVRMIQVAKAATPFQTGVRLMAFGKFFTDIFPSNSCESIGFRCVDRTGGKHVQGTRQVGQSIGLAGRNIAKSPPPFTRSSRLRGHPKNRCYRPPKRSENRSLQFETHFLTLRLEEACWSSTKMISSV